MMLRQRALLFEQRAWPLREIRMRTSDVRRFGAATL